MITPSPGVGSSRLVKARVRRCLNSVIPATRRALTLWSRRPKLSISSGYTDVIYPQIVVLIHTSSTAPRTGSSTTTPCKGWLRARNLRWIAADLKGALVHCPFCRYADSRVLDSRVADDGSSVRRRRQCPQCERRFSTVEQMQLVVVKKSGVAEPFQRDKVIAGVRKACKGRPVSDDDLARLGQRVEDSLRAAGCAEIDTEDVGIAILQPLRDLDPVAYLRFASVYKHYDTLDDFEAEITQLRTAAAPADSASAPAAGKKATTKATRRLAAGASHPDSASEIDANPQELLPV